MSSTTLLLERTSIPLAELVFIRVDDCAVGLMETEGEGEAGKLRRSPAHPLPDNSEESKLNLQARTAYAKGVRLQTTN
jgi:hypothetical protein